MPESIRPDIRHPAITEKACRIIRPNPNIITWGSLVRRHFSKWRACDVTDLDNVRETRALERVEGFVEALSQPLAQHLNLVVVPFLKEKEILVNTNFLNWKLRKIFTNTNLLNLRTFLK